MITESTDFTVHHETLQVDVRSAQAGKSGCLIAAARLDPDETVLDNVDTANTVTTGNRVGSQEQLNRVSDRLFAPAFRVLELNRGALFKVKNKVFRGIMSRKRVFCQLPHIRGRSRVGVFQDAGLVGAVGQVLVHTPRLGLGRGDGDALLGGVGEQIISALEAVVEDRVSPWGDDLDIRLQGVKGQFEADLVIALARATVGNGKASLLLGNVDLCTSNHRTSQRGS